MICILHCVPTIQSEIFHHHLFDPLYPVLSPNILPSCNHHTVVCAYEFLFVCFSHLFICYFQFYIPNMGEIVILIRYSLKEVIVDFGEHIFMIEPYLIPFFYSMLLGSHVLYT